MVFFAFFSFSPNLAFEIILSWFDVPCNSHNWCWKQCVKRRENLHVFLKLDVEMCVKKAQVLIQTKSHRLKLIVVFYARKASFALSIILISSFPSRKKIKRLHFLHNFLNKINDALHNATNYFHIWCEIASIAPCHSRVISERVGVNEKDVISLMYSQPTTDFDLNTPSFS